MSDYIKKYILINHLFILINLKCSIFSKKCSKFIYGGIIIFIFYGFFYDETFFC